jgi:hypothetical protein
MFFILFFPLQEGGLNSGWRPGVTGATAVPKIPSRFDTTSGPARWKDEANGRRLDGAGSGGDRWTEVGPGGSHLAQAFPTDLFSSGDRWAAPDPNAGRGRGRGMVGFQDPSIVGGAGVTWKPRAEGAPVGAPPGAAGGPEWRGAGSEVNPRNDWRNDRWNAAPGSRNSQDTWRGAGGPGGGPSAGRGVGVGGPVGFNSGAPGGLGGLGGGFSIGRGSGTFTRSDSINSANGAGRGSGAAVGGASLAASGRSPSSSFFRSFGPGGGVGGSLAWGPSKAQRRYTTDQLAFVYRQLLYSARLKLPRSVERDDPLLFVADGDFVDVVEQFSGVDPRISAEVYLEHQALMQRVHSRGFLPGGGALSAAGGDVGGVGSMAMSPPQGQLQGLPEEHQLHQQMHHQQMQQPHSAFIDPMPSQQQQQHQLLQQQQQQQPVQQQQQQMMGAADPGWVYRDPQGMVQGPFPKQDIVEWFQGGFFPLELQLRPATDPPNAPFYPLSDLLQIWRGPAAQMIGGPAGFAPQQQQQPQQQQHGFVGGMGMPQEMVSQQQQGNSVGFIGQQVPQQAQQQLHQHLGGGGGLSDELMLSGHLQHLSMGGLSAPQQQQLSEDSFAPAPFDPIVDPALVKRSASTNMLVQQESLGGGLLGSQQQQQQESRQPAWNAAPAAAPPAAQAAAAQPGGGLSLAAIQEEEQRRMREQEEQSRQQQQMAAAPPPPPPPPQGPPSGYEMEPFSPQRQRPETKVAPWVSSVPTPESAGKTLLEIQAEESERQAQLEAQLAQQAAANRLAAGPPGGGWARVARGTTVSGPASGPSLLEIQQAEERAKAAAAGEDDDSLFWEYDKPASGGAPPSSHNAVMPPPPPAPKAKVGGWAAAASKAPVVVPISAKPNGAAAGARPATIAVVRPPPPPPPRSASSSGMPAFVPPSASDEDMAAILAAAAGESAGDGSSSSALSVPFRSWCVEQMQDLTGSTDVTLCEFLMTVESNSEVAEYVSTYLGATPTAAKFTAEFLKLKLAEQASTGKKSRKARAKANAAAAALTNGGASAGKVKGGASGAGGDDDTDTSWAQVSDGGAKKAKKKGQKAEGTMLFSSGTNYSLLDDA